MRRSLLLTSVVAVLVLLCSCAKKEPTASSEASGQRATVVMRDGTRTTGTVTASSATEITLAGDDRITRTIPMSQVRSVEYGDAAAAPATAPAPGETAATQPEPARPAAPKKLDREPATTRRGAEPEPRRAAPGSPAAAPATAAAPAAPPARTYVVPAGAELAVRANETIDSSKAEEGQTFAALVAKDVQDASGDVLIPRGSDAQIVIRSASQGGRIRGASDLTLDLQSVTIRGRRYDVQTADVTQRGRSGIGANKRTAEYTGGGAALGAVIGAIAGGGKGAAIGAGAGAGAGALTQILTKGRSIKVPVETVLTFKLDQPLQVTAAR